MTEPKWMEIARAEMADGVVEIDGPESNPRIQEYDAAAGIRQDDEVPWCSAFANWCIKKAGLPGTDSGAARSWLTWGEKLKVPRVGAVAVFSRDDPKHGHVAFYVSETPTQILVLGGNQKNCVCIKSYEKSRLLAYRWPKGPEQ